MLREMVVDGYVEVRFVRMCEIIPSVESGEAATADWANWWIATGSKTYHRDYAMTLICEIFSTIVGAP